MSDDDFDLKLGQALKFAGMESSADSKKDLLALGRQLCHNKALLRNDRTATADDAARGFKLVGLPPDCLGNASGSLFRGKEWTWTGEWQQSRRVTNHARVIRIWRLAS